MCGKSNTGFGEADGNNHVACAEAVWECPDLKIRESRSGESNTKDVQRQDGITMWCAEAVGVQTRFVLNCKLEEMFGESSTGN
jgi:hypothetical protein